MYFHNPLSCSGLKCAAAFNMKIRGLYFGWLRPPRGVVGASSGSAFRPKIWPNNLLKCAFQLFQSILEAFRDPNDGDNAASVTVLNFEDFQCVFHVIPLFSRRCLLKDPYRYAEENSEYRENTDLSFTLSVRCAAGWYLCRKHLTEVCVGGQTLPKRCNLVTVVVLYPLFNCRACLSAYYDCCQINTRTHRYML